MRRYEMGEWKKLEDGSEVLENRFWRLRVFDMFEGKTQAFAVDAKREDGGWVEMYMSTSGSSPREVAKEAALVVLSWYRDTANWLLPTPTTPAAPTPEQASA
jgi:hypothetical protein